MDNAQLAIEIPISRTQVSRWLAGTTFPKPDLLSRLAECLRVPLNELTELWHVARLEKDNGYFKEHLARTNFYDAAKRDGVTVLGEYMGTDVKVPCICKNGHRCDPRPHSIVIGQGWCMECYLVT
jgi:hypothetical protein